MVVTVPFDRNYRETFVDHDVYERQQLGAAPVFFERHYDRASLATRLLSSRSAELCDLTFWGEGSVRMEALLNWLGPLRTPVSPFEAFLSTALLREVDPDGGDHPMAAFFTLRRPVE